MCDCLEYLKKKLLGKNILSLKVLSTNPEKEGGVFVIGAVIKDQKGNTVDKFIGRYPTKEKHPSMVNAPETHRDFYHLVEDFSKFCKKHSDTYMVIWDSISIEFIFVEQLILYGLLQDTQKILFGSARGENLMRVATLMGVKIGTGEDKGNILFIPEVTIKLFRHILLSGNGIPLQTPPPNRMGQHPTLQ